MSEIDRVPFVLPPVPRDFVVRADGAVAEVPQQTLQQADPGDLILDPRSGQTWPVEPQWLDGAIQHFSPSSLRLLKVCPEAYRQRYILHRKERPGEALTLGSATHAAIAHSHRQKVTTHVDLPVSEVVEYFHDLAWPEAIEKDGGVDEIRWDDQENARRDGERMTQAYHSTVSPRVQPVSEPEQKITVHVEGVPVPIIGYLDTEEETNGIDVKTGKQVQRKPDGNWRFQGNIYALALGKPFHFHSLSRAKTPSIATPLTDPEMALPFREDIAVTTRQVLVDYAAQVEFFFNRYGPDEPWPTSGVFMDYRGGPACNYCGFRKWCPAWAWERAPVVDTIGGTA